MENTLTNAERVAQLLAELSTLTQPVAEYAAEHGLVTQTVRTYAQFGRIQTINTGSCVVLNPDAPFEGDAR
ncbi:hypothetical protein [Luteococcus peritonei]|uniref:DNA-binding protein n=1 Tax=Luteococcus peritonei TaxID=88874 RepID=A0ABW4RVE8_9ACTN